MSKLLAFPGGIPGTEMVHHGTLVPWYEAELTVIQAHMQGQRSKVVATKRKSFEICYTPYMDN